MMKKIKLLITKILSAFLPIVFLYCRNKVCVLLHDKSVMDVRKKKEQMKCCLETLPTNKSTNPNSCHQGN